MILFTYFHFITVKQIPKQVSVSYRTFHKIFNIQSENVLTYISSFKFLRVGIWLNKEQLKERKLRFSLQMLSGSKSTINLMNITHLHLQRI